MGKVNRIGRVLLTARAIRIYMNGDVPGFVWAWWHPLSWVLAPALFIAASVCFGVPSAIRDRKDFGFGVDPWFAANGVPVPWVPVSEKEPRDEG